MSLSALFQVALDERLLDIGYGKDRREKEMKCWVL